MRAQRVFQLLRRPKRRTRRGNSIGWVQNNGNSCIGSLGKWRKGANDSRGLQEFAAAAWKVHKWYPV